MILISHAVVVPAHSEIESLDDLPEPRPAYEIFVYSPRMEGVHLRGGMIARGGLRWSDRKEDFRTEVLGLMKAQNVKNTIIVPVGAKGGFVVKHLPESGSRDEVMAEVVKCYKIFINGLLDITDNLDDEKIEFKSNIVMGFNEQKISILEVILFSCNFQRSRLGRC